MGNYGSGGNYILGTCIQEYKDRIKNPGHMCFLKEAMPGNLFVWNYVRLCEIIQLL